jgi:hypothetical protein
MYEKAAKKTFSFKGEMKMKNYTVMAKTANGVVEAHFDSEKAAYNYFNSFIEVMAFEWAEIADHANAEVIEYLEAGDLFC